MFLPSITLDNHTRLFSYFCSDTVFNLTRNILTEVEIKILENHLEHVSHCFQFKQKHVSKNGHKILEKQLDYVLFKIKSTSRKERIQDIEQFYCKMHPKWEFHNEAAFKPKVCGNHLAAVLVGNFFKPGSKDLVEIINVPLGYSNFSKKKWQFLCS